MNKQDYKDRISVIAEDEHRKYFSGQQSYLFIGGHIHNQEWQAQCAPAIFDVLVYGIYRPLSNKAMDALVLKIRSRLGNKLVPMRQTMRALAEIKNKPGIIAMIGDQTPPRDEIHYKTTFLNQSTPFYSGIQKMAYLSNLPVIFAYLKKRRRGYYEICLEEIGHPPYDTNSNSILDNYVVVLERIIREDPSSWLWSHNKWKHSGK